MESGNLEEGCKDMQKALELGHPEANNMLLNYCK